MKNRLTTMSTGALAALVFGAGAATAGVVHNDEATLLQTMDHWVIEDFENASGAVSGMDFGSAMGAQVVTSGVHENRIETTTDGHGAWAYEGDRFWKLRGGASTLELGGDYQGFGFWYSDIEGAKLHITFHGDSDVTVELTGHNSNGHDFFGFSDIATSFDAVTIEWTTKQGDGIGIDRMIAGTFDVPAPGAAALAVGMGLCVVRRGRRMI